jgi:hypothetical protein
MLFEDIRRAADAFHRHPKSWNRFYSQYLRTRNQELWDSCRITCEEAAILKQFLNQWSTHYQAKPEEMAKAINCVLPNLRLLQDESLLYVDFNRALENGKTVEKVIEEAFDTLVSCGGRHESTGASKILHVINPNLFVMWDMRIRTAYRVRSGGDGFAYSRRFLRKMQEIARAAVDECKQHLGLTEEEAVHYICGCGDTLAKVIDEYNWATYVGGVEDGVEDLAYGSDGFCQDP